MSLQWTLVAGVLYAEIAVLFLLMAPFIRPKMWAKFFNNGLIKTLRVFSYVYVWAGAAILLLLFVDAIRETMKYSSIDVNLEHPHSDCTVHMRLFRAQRNLYISGFALFLWLVMRRVVELTTRLGEARAD